MISDKSEFFDILRRAARDCGESRESQCGCGLYEAYGRFRFEPCGDNGYGHFTFEPGGGFGQGSESFAGFGLRDYGPNCRRRNDDCAPGEGSGSGDNGFGSWWIIILLLLCMNSK